MIYWLSFRLSVVLRPAAERGAECERLRADLEAARASGEAIEKELAQREEKLQKLQTFAQVGPSFLGNRAAGMSFIYFCA